jgi:hypothetical protein
MGLAVKQLRRAVKQLGLAVKQLGSAALYPSSRNLDALTAGSRELLTLFISEKKKAIGMKIFLFEKIKNGTETDLHYTTTSIQSTIWYSRRLPSPGFRGSITCAIPKNK